jgi:transcription termination factor NusB
MLDVTKINVKKMFIVNLLTGYLWVWDVEELPKIEDIILNVISYKYEWHELEKQALI